MDTTNMLTFWNNYFQKKYNTFFNTTFIYLDNNIIMTDLLDVLKMWMSIALFPIKEFYFN